MMKFPLQGGSHASSSHEAFLEPTFKRCEDLGKHSVETQQILQGLHAEDAMAKPYLMLKNLVT